MLTKIKNHIKQSLNKLSSGIILLISIILFSSSVALTTYAVKNIDNTNVWNADATEGDILYSSAWNEIISKLSHLKESSFSNIKMNSNTTCDSSNEGAVRYDATNKTFLGCDGEGTWIPMDQKSSKSGFKNYIINGGFDIWQRGETDTYSGSAWRYGSADRWRYFTKGGSTGEATMSKSTMDIDGKIVNAFDWNQTTANLSNKPNLEQVIEDLNLPAGINVTLSFYFSKISGSTFPNIMVYDGVNGSIIEKPVLEGFNSLNFTVPTNRNNLRIRFAGVKSEIFNYKIAQVQLEEGPVATSFEHRPYGLELSLCQRYYEEIDLSGRYDFYYIAPWKKSNAMFDFKEEKRIEPICSWGFTSITNIQPGGGTGTPSVISTHKTYITPEVSHSVDPGYQEWQVSHISGGKNERVIYCNAEL